MRIAKLTTSALALGLVLALQAFVGATPSRAGTVTNVGATNDATYAYYQLGYGGSTDSFYRVYVDADRSATTGFQVGGIGAEYLIENGFVYQYNGPLPGSTTWAWTNQKAVAAYSVAHGVANWTVARADLGKTATPSTADLVFQSETSGVKSTSAKSTQTFTSTVSATYAASTAVIPNPERGFYHFIQGTTCDANPFTVSQLQGWRTSENITLAMCTFYIANRGSDISTTQLDAFKAQMKAVRDAGLKAIVRFAFTNQRYTNGADLVFEVQNSGQGAIDTAKYTHTYSASTPVGTGSTIATYQATYDSTNVTYTYTTVGGPYSCNRAYIDVDQSAVTGFLVGGIGADYLLETCSGTTPNSATLYRFTGTQGTNQWSWATTVDTNLTYSNNGTQVSFTIPRLDIGETQSSDNFTGNDAPKDVVMRDLDLLAPALQSNSDVIAVVQAGLIGTWGEWYYSQFFGNAYGLPASDITSLNWADRHDIVSKLLSIVPSNRDVQVRSPHVKQTLLTDTTPLDESTTAFNGSYKARLGHHNDCFLDGPTDSGTYSDVATTRDQEKSYLQADTNYVPMGGETCVDVLPDTHCYAAAGGRAMDELQRFHWSFIDQDWLPAVISRWQSEGCLTDIQKYLGYRFVLTGGTYGSSVSKSAGLPVRITIRNDGWASTYNTRNVDLVMRDTSTGAVYQLPLNADPRKWYAGTTNVVNQTVSLASVPAGTYALLLNLPDPAASLSTSANNAYYAIQTANTGTWEASTGYNNLNATVTVTP